MDGKGALLSKFGIGALAALMLMGGLCQKTKGTTITVVNGTGSEIHNVEVTYSGGNVGTASIAVNQELSKWVPAKGDCYVKLTFLDATRKQVQSSPVQTKGQPCPSSVKFFIEPDFRVVPELK